MSAVLEVASANCEQHGDYERRQVYGRWVGRCQKCSEIDRERRMAEDLARARAERIDYLLGHADLPPRFANKGFEGYEPRTSGQAQSLQACRRYVAELDRHVAAGTCLVLIGPPGVGKTHLMVAVAADACRSEVRARYTTMATFLAALRGSWEWHAEEHAESFLTPRVLVLDEVWTPPSAREAGALLALIDERYRRGVPTLVASNLTWPQMQADVGARFCDRLLEGGGQVIAVDGKSARGNKS